MPFQSEKPVVHGVPVDPTQIVRVSSDLVMEGMGDRRVSYPTDDGSLVGELLHTPLRWPRAFVRTKDEAPPKVIIFPHPTL